MYKLMAIGLGGFFGAVLRYSISGYFYRLLGAQFPWGTFAVNIIGSFVLGFLMALTETRIQLNPMLKVSLTIGLMGAFTTFSTFSYETFSLIQIGQHLRAFYNVFFSVLFGLLAIWLGIIAARYI